MSMLAQRVNRISARTPLRLLSKIKEDCTMPQDCWKCEKALDCLKEKFFCPACSAIQPLENENFFDYLGVRPSFDVDVSVLKKHFLELQSRIHPDKFSRCSKKEKEISELCSSYLNDAYHTLTEPLRRAQYLLKLRGEGTNPEETASSGEFLVEMMELNEEADSLDSQAEINEMLKRIDDRIDILCAQFKEDFESGRTSAAKEAVVKMTFFYRLRANLNKKLGFS
ncbi:Iron-sulfur cluster co-chaperone protein HscB, mitochondrial [Toxocara canis]|uniref:Iron-sulfur cluster co-chaperone protein HscB, mitochondrial n=1 Tax=Toxocara canis TaxID=6265 RepID=A0A0B2V808_TOXCA|nr:Iron-sulfur cluster co-chaperone protein HscB, mitochondrial [Toxocara canis]